MPETDTRKPAKKDIRDALRRVLSHGEFQASERMSRFLTYVVEEQLAGRGEAIKGYAIGIEVFDRDEDFSPEQDSVVRVEAIRLRRALQSYYLTNGKDDPVVIDVPKGGYSPVFSYRAEDDNAGISHRDGKSPAGDSETRGPATRLGALPKAAAALGLLVLVSAASFWLGSTYRPGAGEFSEHEKQSLKSALTYPESPSIAVLPFSAIGMGDDIVVMRAIYVQLISDLTRFKGLSVVGAATTSPYFGLIGDLQPIAEKYNVRYILSGVVQRDKSDIIVIAQLYDSSDGKFIWSNSFTEKYDITNLLRIQNDISGRIAGTIGQPYGIINRAETRRLPPNNAQSLTSYQCVLSFYEYAGNKRPEDHARARACLVETVQREPKYTRAWIALSGIYADEARYGFNPAIRDRPAIELAREAAERAVSLSPSDATAHQSLATILFEHGDWRAAREHLATALALNPNDAELLADAGWTYAKMGEWEVGRDLVEKARRLNPGHPSWYYGLLFAYYYRQGEYEQALRYAEGFFEVSVLLSHVGLTATYGMLGDVSNSARSLAMLVDNFPNFARHPRLDLQPWHLPEDLVSALLEGLRKAGMVLPPSPS